MRVTISIADALFHEVEDWANATGRTVDEVVEAALTQAIRPVQRVSSQQTALPIFVGGALQPGVDLDSSASLLELMESSASLDGPS